MAVISRATNEKPSNNRFGGNWRTEAAKASAGLGTLGALGLLSYFGSKGLSQAANPIKEVSTPFYSASSSGFPITPFYSAISGGFPDLS